LCYFSLFVNFLFGQFREAVKDKILNGVKRAGFIQTDEKSASTSTSTIENEYKKIRIR
jgi:hypothetical protein